MAISKKINASLVSLKALRNLELDNGQDVVVTESRYVYEGFRFI